MQPPIPVYYLISRNVQTPSMIMIHHVLKVVETTLDKVDAVYQREAYPFIAQGINIYTLILDRPANLDFLKQLEQANKEEGHTNAY